MEWKIRLFPFLAVAAFVAGGCMQSPPASQTSPVTNPSTAPAATSAAPVAVFVPPGGPLPDQLLGDWYLPPAAVNAAITCSAPVTQQNCNLRMILTATTYRFAGTRPSGPGDVVVNGSEIDFYNASQCSAQGSDGNGRYTWALTSGVLRLTPLNSDPCGRSVYLANQSFSHTP